jgi:hypothetical protein
MRPSLCAAALALLPHCFAVPSFRSSGNGSIKQPAVQPEPQDEETLKYFHEPGFVCSLKPIDACRQSN